jgi:hypothetical protein
MVEESLTTGCMAATARSMLDVDSEVVADARRGNSSINRITW